MGADTRAASGYWRLSDQPGVPEASHVRPTAYLPATGGPDQALRPGAAHHQRAALGGVGAGHPGQRALHLAPRGAGGGGDGAEPRPAGEHRAAAAPHRGRPAPRCGGRVCRAGGRGDHLAATTPVLLVLDESSHAGWSAPAAAEPGLSRQLSAAGVGGLAAPAAKLPPGAYWRHLDGVLARAEAMLPQDVQVVVLADRAYDVPPLLDRLAALGWDWIIRVKARSKLVWRGDDGAEQPLRTLVASRPDPAGHAACAPPARRSRRRAGAPCTWSGNGVMAMPNRSWW